MPSFSVGKRVRRGAAIWKPFNLCALEMTGRSPDLDTLSHGIWTRTNTRKVPEHVARAKIDAASADGAEPARASALSGRKAIFHLPSEMSVN